MSGQMTVLAAVCVGAVLRVALYLVSRGSNDIENWASFGQLIREVGLHQAYEREQLLNNPPIIALWGACASALSKMLNLPFPLIFKVPSVVADVGTVWLLGTSFDHARSSAGFRAWVYALSVPAILITSFHGNTDAICVFFVVLSLVLLRQPRQSFLGGVVLALAINVKIIPLILVPVLVATLPELRARVRFIGGVLLGCVPLLVAVGLFGEPFVRNVFRYRSLLEPWGINLLLMHSAAATDLYRKMGGSVIIAMIVVLAVYQLFRKSFKLEEVTTLAICIFLVFAPGFGIQYLIYAAPLLLLVSTRIAVWYHLCAGGMALACYGSFLSSWYPLGSYHTGPFPSSVALVGGLAWVSLVLFLYCNLRARVMRRTVPLVVNS